MSGALRIAILNPNATEWMTDDMVVIARGAAPAGCEVVGRTNLGGPPAIQGPEDAAASLPGLIAMHEAALREGADAVILGCFDDTGIDILRSRGTVPVVGLGEASCRSAAAAAPRFHVVTTLAVSIPVIEENIRAMGLWARCGSVRASGVPVLDLPERIGDVQAAIDGVLAEDPGAAIVLGCAGMSQIVTALRGAATAPLVDPVRAAIAMAVAQAEATAAQGG
jgi:allantoin racemase